MSKFKIATQMKHTGLGIHIALSKYPLGYEKKYIENLQLLYTSYTDTINRYLALNTKYNSKSKKELKDLYNPSIFHVFSHFDVAFISLVDNFKFPQKVFEPLIKEEELKIKSVSYQILSGSIIQTDLAPDPKIVLKTNSEFVKIIQLKLNNGLLIGNGAILFEECIQLLEGTLTKSGITNYIFINSFNWGEITILCFDKDANSLANVVMRMRLLTIESIKNRKVKQKIKLNSLYNQWKLKHIENSHLFSETLSYLGIDYFNFKDFEPQTNFFTNIEWQIKPGHFPYIAKELNSTLFHIDDKYSNIYYKDGKTDYLIIGENSKIIDFNIKLFNELRSNSKIRSHIRKVKTKPLYEIDAKIAEELNEIKKNPFDNPNNSEDILSNYRIDFSKDVSKYLKKLNVSRNVRKKINKIIYNYNLGIQDPILYIYFIDLHKLLLQFVDTLKLLSIEIVKSIDTGKLSDKFSANNFVSLKTIYIQNELIDIYIKVFQGALNDRILNNYNYEDINEFSLDVNSSMTNIVSSLDSIIKFYGSCFRDSEGNSIITTINDNETISNKLSVNYNIEHITNAPLVFATLIKEILNIEQTLNSIKNSNNFYNLNIEFNEKINEREESEKEFLMDFLKALNFAYFEIDFKKYHLTFFKDTNLYIFWHWTYAFQCTHLYSSVGYFDEVNFTRELFRLVLLLKATDSNKISSLSCPIPELRTYWDKYFNRIKNLVEFIGNTAAFTKVTDSLREQIENDINNINTLGEKNSSKMISSTNDIDEFLDRLHVQCKEKTLLNVNDFIKFIYAEIDILNNPKLTPTKSAYYRVLSYISIYNLTMIQVKFNGKFRLLRRNYLTGTPIEYFLKNDNNWYIDPFGGFFINNFEERVLNMSANNQMLFLIWHLGVIIKKTSFI